MEAKGLGGHKRAPLVQWWANPDLDLNPDLTNFPNPAGFGFGFDLKIFKSVDLNLDLDLIWI